MIISRALGFAFVKARKVGGTSVEMALSTLCSDPEDIISPITPIDEQVRSIMGGAPRNFSKQGLENHASLREMEAKIDLSGLRIVGVIRSPYSIAVSLANHSIGFRDYQLTGSPMIASFSRIRRVIDKQLEMNRWNGRTLCDYYRNRNGDINIEALRFESLDDDFIDFAASIKTGPIPRLPRVKQGLNLSASDAAALLRPDQRRRVSEIFAEDLERFNFKRF